jgi:hypothetical protein
LEKLNLHRPGLKKEIMNERMIVACLLFVLAFQTQLMGEFQAQKKENDKLDGTSSKSK